MQPGVTLLARKRWRWSNDTFASAGVWCVCGYHWHECYLPFGHGQGTPYSAKQQGVHRHHACHPPNHQAGVHCQQQLCCFHSISVELGTTLLLYATASACLSKHVRCQHACMSQVYNTHALMCRLLVSWGCQGSNAGMGQDRLTDPNLPI